MPAFLLRFDVRMPPAYLRHLAYHICRRGEVGGQTTDINLDVHYTVEHSLDHPRSRNECLLEQLLQANEKSVEPQTILRDELAFHER